jgi:hypothetical protein
MKVSEAMKVLMDECSCHFKTHVLCDAIWRWRLLVGRKLDIDETTSEVPMVLTKKEKN